MSKTRLTTADAIAMPGGSIDLADGAMRELYRRFVNKRALAVASIWSILNKIFDLAPPLMVALIVDVVQDEAPNWWANSSLGDLDNWGTAVVLGSIVLIVHGFESGFQYLMDRGFQRLAQSVQHELRVTVYSHMQSLELAFFESHRLGDTLSMLNDDINTLERFLNTGANTVLQMVITIIFAAITMFSTSWELALIGFSILPLIAFASIKYTRIIKPRYGRLRQTVGELASRLENSIAGVAVVKAFTAEAYETSRVAAASERYREANLAAIRVSSAFVPLIRMAVALGFAGVVLVGSFWVQDNPDKLTVGELVLFSMLIQRVLWPLTRLGQVVDELERARASARRTFGLLHRHPRITDPASPKELQRAQGAIHFRDVEFHYEHKHKPDDSGASDESDGPELILKGLNLDIEAGAFVGIAGSTGAGKSTIAKLLLRLYDPTGGVVAVDDTDLREFRLADLRRNIALVSQDVYLFHGTIRDNIAYGTDNSSEEAIIQASQMAQLHEFVETLPAGYNTLVGERGIKLSGGQRQRLSIARALLKDAPISLFDEATAAVDTATERAIQQNLRALTRGRTSIVIAHRLSTIRDADRIIVLSGGGIVEDGTHEELLNIPDGVFAGLWELQTGEGGHGAAGASSGGPTVDPADVGVSQS